MIKISGDFFRQARREWRFRFKKNVGVFLVSFGVGGCSWVVCCLFASRCGDCWFVVRVGSHGYGSWCGARHPPPRSGGHFSVLGSLGLHGEDVAAVRRPRGLPRVRADVVPPLSFMPVGALVALLQEGFRGRADRI